LIRFPLEWQLTAATLPHPAIPELAERDGTQLKTPGPVILVDTRPPSIFHVSKDGFQGSRRNRCSWAITQWWGWKTSALWNAKICPI
jgi:hypothetical protein